MVTFNQIEAGTETLGLCQINQSCKLVPRYHHISLNYLIQKGFFKDDSVAFAQHLHEEMKQRLEDTAKKNLERKQNVKKGSQQKTIFQCYSDIIKSSDDDYVIPMTISSNNCISANLIYLAIFVIKLVLFYQFWPCAFSSFLTKSFVRKARKISYPILNAIICFIPHPDQYENFHTPSQYPPPPGGTYFMTTP